MSIKVLISNTLWSTINHVFSRGILMLSGILLAKHLIPKDFAIYSYYQMTMVMISSYAALGLGVAASKFFAEFSVCKDNQENRDTITTLSGISLIVSLVVAVGIFFIPEKLLGADLGIPSYIFSISVLTLGLNVIPNGAILGLEKYKEATLISLINGIFCLIGVYLAIDLNQVYYSIYFFIIACSVQLIGQSYLISKSLDGISFKNRFMIKKKSISKIFSFLGPLVLVSILTALSGWIIGRSLLSIYGEYIFSVYSIGLQWFALALFIPGMISRVILPRLIRGNIENSDNKKILKISCGISLLFSFIIFLLGYMSRDYLIGFYGSYYQEYKNIIIFFLLIAVLYAPANTLGNAIVAKLGSLPWLIITLIWFVLLLLIFYICIAKYNIMAAIYSQGIATFTLLMLSYFLCKKKGLI